MLWGIYNAIYGEVNVSVEKCVEIKERLCWKIAKLFYFSHLKKLVRPETFGPYYVCFHRCVHQPATTCIIQNMSHRREGGGLSLVLSLCICVLESFFFSSSSSFLCNLFLAFCHLSSLCFSDFRGHGDDVHFPILQAPVLVRAEANVTRATRSANKPFFFFRCEVIMRNAVFLDVALCTVPPSSG